MLVFKILGSGPFSHSLTTPSFLSAPDYSHLIATLSDGVESLDTPCQDRGLLISPTVLNIPHFHVE